PLEPIRIKLSIDSFRTRDGFVLLTYVLVQDLHGCPSFSRSLGRQTCGGGTHMDEEAAQGEFGLKIACLQRAAKAWQCRTSFSRLRSRCLCVQRCARLWGQRAELSTMSSMRP